MKAKNILVIYLSRTNNTKAVAQIIHKALGGALVSLELVRPYAENYKATVQQVAEENSTDFLPLLKTRIDSIAKYDVVFLGFPTWDMKLLPPVKSFLKQYDLTGKTLIPFNTNAGYGVGNNFESVKQLCTSSEVLEGYSTKGGIEREGGLICDERGQRKPCRSRGAKLVKKNGFGQLKALLKGTLKGIVAVSRAA